MRKFAGRLKKFSDGLFQHLKLCRDNQYRRNTSPRHFVWLHSNGRQTGLSLGALCLGNAAPLGRKPSETFRRP
ncbi:MULTISPECIES: hypothetical protein [unclassified Neisseria]|uniref:hypothetical protein n=1 Tax=unclassified Neisseria TaxID=2623750 RepID=UPI0010722702|nr:MULTISPECIES: hypothetical protein [unclassified Neisseria]MBF0804420.1 hypothetical protein [Neisseria sp. 19428wB4_WF04]TFU42791.1 hypothetical protein E4T99_08720 [Neisseria sp. WF04]